MIKNIPDSEDGLSPVIGIILLIAVVFALVVLVTFVVFDISELNNSTDASVRLSSTTSGVSAEVISSENVGKFIVQSPDGREYELSPEPGSNIDLIGPEGQYEIIAILNDGTREVITTEDADDLDYSGVFVVTQNKTEGEAYATLEKSYSNIDEYDLNLDPNASTDGNLVSKYAKQDTSKLLSGNEIQSRPKDIIKLISIVDQKGDPGTEKINGRNVDRASINDVIALHKMVNLCPGDEVILEDTSTGNELASEEIVVDSGCSDLRQVARYLNGEITFAELINLWNLEIDYRVFYYDIQKQPPLPNHPVKDGIVDVEVTVYKPGQKKVDGETVSEAKVYLGNRQKTTNETGKAKFLSIADETEYVVTARKEGYKPAKIREKFIKEQSATSTSIDEKLRTGKLLSNRQELQTEANVKIELELELRDDEISPPSQTGTKSISSGSDNKKIIDNVDRSFSVSSGSGGKGGGGSSSSDATTGSSFSSGSSFYNTNTKSTVTKSFDGSKPPIVPQETQFEQPERIFNVIPIDDSLIPTDGRFKVKTTLATPDVRPVEDRLKIYYVDASKDINDFSNLPDSNEFVNRSITIPEDGEKITEDETTPANAGMSVGEYDIYVYLNGSNEYKHAGYLDVFDSARTGAEITGGEISPKNVKTGDESTVTINNNDIDFNGAQGVRVDIFRNGVRVVDGKEIFKDSANGDTEVTYSETYDEAEYVQYHVGIQESQDIQVLGTVVVSATPETNTGISTWNTDLQITNPSEDCTLSIDTTGNFECEVETGKTLLNFTSQSSTFDFGSVSESDVDNINFTWVLGNEDSTTYEFEDKVINPNDGDPNVTEVEAFFNAYNSKNKIHDLTVSEEGFSETINLTENHTFTNDTVHLVEFRADITINGADYTDRSALFVNALDNPGQQLTRITGTTITKDNTLITNIKNPRESVEETVDLQYVVKEGNTVTENIGSGDFIKNESVTIPPDSSKVIEQQFGYGNTDSETLNLEDFTSNTLEPGDSVNFWVRLSNIKDSNENDFYSTVTMTVQDPDINSTIDTEIVICETASDPACN